MQQAEAGVQARAHRNVILGVVSGGHGLIHWYQQGFWVIFATLKTEMGLNPVQAGLLISMRQLMGGLINVPAGALGDMFRGRIALFMGLSIIWVALAYMLVGLAPNYSLLLLFIALAGMGSTVWHPQAIAVLSHHFPQRKGFAVSTHGVGGNVGDIIAPVAVGALLAFLTWRQLLGLNAIPMVVIGILVIWLLAGVGREGERTRQDLKTYLRGVKPLLGSGLFISLVLLSGIRGMGHQGLFTFLSIYFKEDLNMNSLVLGLHISLLTGLGVVSAPIMGLVSDRLGRKPVLLVGLVAVGVLVLGLAWAGAGWKLTVVVALLGLFIYALQAIIVAAALDLVVRGMEATATGFMFTGGVVLSAVSPVIAGFIVNATGNTQAAFYYVGALFLAGALMVVLLPIRKVGHESI